MKGVLLLAHGSRQKETEETMRQITAMVKQELELDLVEEAFLQFCEKDLEQGLLSLMNRGADEIKVVPYFLFEGTHIKEDIPGELRAFTQRHPQVRIDFGSTLGADQRLAAVLADRVRELY